MKKYLVLLIFTFILAETGCVKNIGNIGSKTGLVEITSFGKGSNKEEALNDAFRNAVEYVSGVIVYDETKVQAG